MLVWFLKQGPAPALWEDEGLRQDQGEFTSLVGATSHAQTRSSNWACQGWLLVAGKPWGPNAAVSSSSSSSSSLHPHLPSPMLRAGVPLPVPSSFAPSITPHAVPPQPRATIPKGWGPSLLPAAADPTSWLRGGQPTSPSSPSPTASQTRRHPVLPPLHEAHPTGSTKPENFEEFSAHGRQQGEEAPGRFAHGNCLD